MSIVVALLSTIVYLCWTWPPATRLISYIWIHFLIAVKYFQYNYVPVTEYPFYGSFDYFFRYGHGMTGHICTKHHAYWKIRITLVKFLRLRIVRFATASTTSTTSPTTTFIHKPLVGRFSCAPPLKIFFQL